MDHLDPRSSKFDMDYYKKTHMPLVQKNWAPHVLGFNVVAFEEGPIQVHTSIYFADKASLGAAMAKEGTAEVMGDIPNFTDSAASTAVGGIAQQV
ncbi:hypothetical protein RQP46_003865 [Phenoliferia psychrophenolica]